LQVYVRPGSSRTTVGGTYDGALVVRVAEPAQSGRATEAALSAVASAIGVPRRSVKLLRGATNRRKLFEIDVTNSDAVRLRSTLDQLRRQSNS
jgi:hypothetical protein